MRKVFYGIAIVSVLFLLVSCARKEKEAVVERKFNTKNENVQANVAKNTAIKTVKTATVDTSAALTKEAEVAKPVTQQAPQVKKVFKTYISKITKDNGSYDIILDNVILVKNVNITDNKIVFPFSESNGKRYYFIWCNEKYLLGKIKDDILHNKIKSLSIKPAITNIKIKKLDKGALQGFAEVEFDNEFSIKSIPIFIGGKYGDNIGNPAVKIDGKYVPMVKILDKEWKKIIQKKVLAKFYKD